MRLIGSAIALLLGVVLPFWVSSTFPQATIQRDSGAAAAGLLVMLVVVVGIDNRTGILDSVARKRKKKLTSASRPSTGATPAAPQFPGVILRGNLSWGNKGEGYRIGRGANVQAEGNKAWDNEGGGFIVEGEDDPRKAP